MTTPSGLPVCAKYLRRSPRNQQPCCTCRLDEDKPCCKCGEGGKGEVMDLDAEVQRLIDLVKVVKQSVLAEREHHKTVEAELRAQIAGLHDELDRLYGITT